MKPNLSRIRFRRLLAWTKAEWITLIAVALAAAFLFAFISIVDEVLEGETRAFDEAVLLAFRNPADPADPVGPWWLEAMFRDLTALGGTAVLTLITFVAIGYLLINRQRSAALLVLISVAGGTMLSHFLKLGFERPRPDLVAHLVDVQTLSFPSGHAMLSAVTYLTLGALLARVQERKRLKAYILGVAIALTLLIGLSRIYLGVHWPTDVLAGWAAGAAWALGCWVVAASLQARGRIERGAADDASIPP